MKVNYINKLILSSFLSIFLGCATESGTHSGSGQEDSKEQAASKAPQEDERFSGENFNEHVRTTEARTPEEERLGFKLPQGFEIQLFASEPDIGKPINMAFDAKGRLWVTQSYEYPFAAEPGTGKDRITILEDTDGDGKADLFTVFQDTLNIPIGILPIHDGAVAYSIPYVQRFFDTDQDGKPEKKLKLLGPFGFKDTHGMINNMVRGYDGWIHSGHGFSNTSIVAGADGDSITMTSGNTFRFTIDGSRVEQTTYGRVNPFGLVYDEWGYLYSSDCHTSPLYQLIEGADYPHFGKKPTGIGFGPDMKPLQRESTALAGLVYYSHDQFPPEYQKNFFIGDVVKCRVYRNSFEFKGTTPVGKAEPDFVLSEDPWFRPVDVKMGPDGAIYVADFYNSIIGHYEVSLNHPKRDRIRGRIWRISYTGNNAPEKNENRDWSSASLSDLITALGHKNLQVRLTVTDQLVDRFGKEAVQPVLSMFKNQHLEVTRWIHGLWVLDRLGSLNKDLLQNAVTHKQPEVRVHAIRIINERKNSEFTNFLKNALKDTDPHVQRIAAEGLRNFPQKDVLEALVDFSQTIPSFDTHLLYTTRLSLRNLLRNENLLNTAITQNWKEKDALVLADALTGVDSEKAANFLFDFIQNNSQEKDFIVRVMQQAPRYLPEKEIKNLIKFTKERFGNDTDSQYEIYGLIQDGLAQRGVKSNLSMRDWGIELAENLVGNKILQAVDQPSTLSKPEEIAQKQRFISDIAGKYKVSSLEPIVLEYLLTPSSDRNVNTTAARSLLQINPGKYLPEIAKFLKDEEVSVELKKDVASVLGDFSGPASLKILENSLQNAPPELQAELVKSMVNTSEGINAVFRQVKNNTVYPRVLLEPKVEERLMLRISSAQKEELINLTKNLDPVDTEKENLIITRLADFKPEGKSLEGGKKLFVQNCSPCHQIGQEGGFIGPQLDGVGNWGSKALAEKILDPNRNISEAFRTYTIRTKDGKTMNGLYRREEGEVVVFANISGEEFSVPKKEIAEQKPSKYTIMPDHFGSILSQDDFNALLSYLISVK